MIASAARYVEPTAFPDYLALDAYATPPRRLTCAPVVARVPRIPLILGGVVTPGRRACSWWRCCPAAPGRCRTSRPRRAAALADPVPYDGRSPIQSPGPSSGCWSSSRGPRWASSTNARAMGAEAQRDVRRLAQARGDALRSALEARGVVLRDVVAYYRVWNGFAATVRTRDLAAAELPRPARAHGPARVSGQRRAGARAREAAARARRAWAGSRRSPCSTPGVDCGALNGHADPGYDAVDRDREPTPGQRPQRQRPQETSGTALAGVIAAAGRARAADPDRLAARRPAARSRPSPTTDQLHRRPRARRRPQRRRRHLRPRPGRARRRQRALRGLHQDSPEAQAVEGAAGLGTLVDRARRQRGRRGARLRHDRLARPRAREALAVGALTGAGALAADRTRRRRRRARRGRRAGRRRRPTAARRPARSSDTDPAVLGEADPRIRGKVVIVRAGANPAAQAAAAAAVGAARRPARRARATTPLPALSAGRAAAPVIGVTGDAAEDVLELEPGTEVSFGATERGRQAADAPARYASRRSPPRARPRAACPSPTSPPAAAR